MKKLLIKFKGVVELNLSKDMGLCDCTSLMGTRQDEIYCWLKKNLPPIKHSSDTSDALIFCFPMGELDPRLKWLDEQIEKL